MITINISREGNVLTYQTQLSSQNSFDASLIIRDRVSNDTQRFRRTKLAAPAGPAPAPALKSILNLPFPPIAYRCSNSFVAFIKSGTFSFSVGLQRGGDWGETWLFIALSTNIEPDGWQRVAKETPHRCDAICRGARREPPPPFPPPRSSRPPLWSKTNKATTNPSRLSPFNWLELRFCKWLVDATLRRLEPKLAPSNFPSLGRVRWLIECDIAGTGGDRFNCILSSSWWLNIQPNGGRGGDLHLTTFNQVDGFGGWADSWIWLENCIIEIGKQASKLTTPVGKLIESWVSLKIQRLKIGRTLGNFHWVICETATSFISISISTKMMRNERLTPTLLKRTELEMPFQNIHSKIQSIKR